MAKPKVVVTRRWPMPVEARLAERFDATLNTDDHRMGTAELQDALRAADALLPTVTDRISAEVLGAGPRRARIIGSFGVGFNHIDLDAAKAAGLTVTNTPEVLTDCTADIAMTLLLMIARRAGEGERLVRAKAWRGWGPTHMMGAKVTGKTLGLIGLGRIGRALAKRAHFGFDMSILFYDPVPPPQAEIDALGAERCATIDELLARADFVSLHCPASKETHHLMNAGRLAQMKAGAYLINSSRGDVVDEAALAEALAGGVIAGAALDVFEAEPEVAEALLALDNVVMFPHLGSASLETRVAMGMRVIDNLTAFFAGETPPDKVV
jgi:lactate dehydrogenase-like 2-hydroxyacid dehydrogenase